MIDRTEFTKRFAMLLDRFGRTMGDPSIREYFEILNAELNTQQFLAAASDIFRNDQFWPTPQRFIDAARGGSTKDLAETAWSEMLEHARKGHYPDKSTLPPATLAALVAAPLREIMAAESDVKLARLKREFCAAHERATETETVPQLTSGTPRLAAS